MQKEEEQFVHHLMAALLQSHFESRRDMAAALQVEETALEPPCSSDALDR